MKAVDDMQRIDLDYPIGLPLFELVDQLALRGYCSRISPIDAQVIFESDERCECGHPVFPIGMQRNDESYRAFAICGSCYRVVFEL